MVSCRQIMVSHSILQLMVELEQSETRIPNAGPTISIFSLTEIVYPTDTENKTKKFLAQLSYCCFELRYHFCPCQKVVTH